MGEGFFDKVKLLVGLESEEEEETPRERKKVEREYISSTNVAPAREIKDNRVIDFQATRNQMKLILLEPKSFDECPKIVDHLKNRKPIILNLEKLESDLARKVFDFISGAVYALDGNVQKVANNIFLFAPENVDIAGNIENHLSQNDFNPWKK